MFILLMITKMDEVKQALIRCMNPGQWGFLTKVKLILKKWFNVPCFDMDESFMVNGHYIKYEEKYTTVIQNRPKYPIFAQSPSIVYVHKASIMVDHCTQHQQNPLIHLRYMATNIQNL